MFSGVSQILMIGIAFDANVTEFELDTEAFVCVPGNNQESIHIFGLLGSFCARHSAQILLSITGQCGTADHNTHAVNTKFALWTSELPNLAHIRFLCTPNLDVSEFPLCTQRDIVNSQSKSPKAVGFDISAWTQKQGFSKPLQTFLQTGVVMPTTSQEIADACLGLFKFSQSRLFQTPAPKRLFKNEISLL